MKKTAIFVLIYGVLVCAGGLIGHYKSGSAPSLISGIVFGALLLIAAFAMFKNKRWGQWLAIILAFALDAFFTWRFAKSLKFMPGGLMSLISLAMVITLALRFNKKR
ncbi:MAG: TMEM14 family protein [Chlamydiae bacterium]|nr:TMEM14 family protein [Chlamydiota bacterium]